MTGPASENVEAIDSRLDNGDFRAVFDELRPLCTGKGAKSADLRFLVRFSRACMLVADDGPSSKNAAADDDVNFKDFRKKHLKIGQQAALTAVKVSLEGGGEFPVHEVGRAHKWVAILTGLLDEFCEGTSERIANGHLIKENADKAAKLIPTDPYVFQV